MIEDEKIPQGKNDLPEEEEPRHEDRNVPRASIRVNLKKLLKAEDIVREVRVCAVDGTIHDRGIQHDETGKKSPRFLQVPKVDYRDVKQTKSTVKRGATKGYIVPALIERMERNQNHCQWTKAFSGTTGRRGNRAGGTWP